MWQPDLKRVFLHMSEHVLVTILGLLQRERDDPKKIIRYEYGLCGKTHEAPMAPIALFHLLRSQQRVPTRVLALCTAKARKETYPVLEEALVGECEVLPVAIPSGEEPEDIGLFLDIFGCSAPDKGILTLETTHGFRHYALFVLLGALYIDALRPDLDLQNIYYALLKGQGQISPYIDLRELLDFSQWIYAANTFRDTGSALPMAKLIKKVAHQSETAHMTRNLEKLTLAISDALPLELGMEATIFKRQNHKHLYKLIKKSLPSSKLSGELRDRVKEQLELFELAWPAGKEPAKMEIALDPVELERQARLIDCLYEEYGSHAAAFGLMREWVVSWAMLQLGPSDSGWLDKGGARQKAENALGLLGKLDELHNEGKSELCLSEAQTRLARFWRDQLGPTRNLTHHHGMNLSNAFGNNGEERTRKAWQYWSETMKCQPNIDLSPIAGEYRRLIVSPLGKTPGVLFSAMRSLNSTADSHDCCLVITSEQTRSKMNEALDRAGFAGRREMLLFQDPFSGLHERQALWDKATAWILAAEETHVNVTGGTSLMGLLSEEIANKARELQRLASRFVLIDERPHKEQIETPYVEGTRIVVEPDLKEWQ